MTKVLITGANGQLGREMRRAMAGTGCQCLFTDISELDITDRDAVCRMIESNGVNVIVNCAAYTNVDRAEDDRETADLINNQAVANLAMAAKEGGATLIHVSTDYVFDGCGCVPYKEDDATAPTGIYGVTKLAG
ncbi:MAG TPA: sugar nucleotide-binding protein, partial [Candidatus Avibacteroides faecavium]|nr:sugar nucleotide-binding protein [Candidatus Avibacteroides faecavium]